MMASGFNCVNRVTKQQLPKLLFLVECLKQLFYPPTRSGMRYPIRNRSYSETVWRTLGCRLSVITSLKVGGAFAPHDNSNTRLQLLIAGCLVHDVEMPMFTFIIAVYRMAHYVSRVHVDVTWTCVTVCFQVSNQVTLTSSCQNWPISRR